MKERDTLAELEAILEKKKGLGPGAMIYGPNPFKKTTFTKSIKAKFKKRKGDRK